MGFGDNAREVGKHCRYLPIFPLHSNYNCFLPLHLGRENGKGNVAVQMKATEKLVIDRYKGNLDKHQRKLREHA